MSSSSNTAGIIVAVDGSPESMVATEWAVRHAAVRHVPMSVVTVLAESEFGGSPKPTVPTGCAARRGEHSQRILDDALRTTRRAVLVHGPVEVQHRSCVGSAVPTLVNLSKGASMIVVGSRGLGAVKRRLQGSVSTGLVHHAHCPVAVIHDDWLHRQNAFDAPILVGIDDSPASELATAIAFDEASRRGLELIAMHGWIDDDLHGWSGIDWDRQLEAGRQVLGERLAGWCERYPDVPVEQRLVSGDPKAELISASESAQLTVIGSHGREGFAGMLLGSVSTAVVQAARMPVVVARSS